ncbi:MAG: hypothetical protein IT289_04005 [Oligoflexia bacterium]|nr:hypothetical protein [Oligoflexia bacterium]
MKNILILIFIPWMALAQEKDQQNAKAKATPAPAPAVVSKPKTNSVEPELPLQPSKWLEVNSIIDEIKEQNPPRNFKLKAKAGLVQMIVNTDDPIKLGLGSNLPAIGFEGVANVFGNFGLEARSIFAMNLVPDPTSPNTASSYIYWLDIGPRYTLYMDSTKLDNNLAFKVLFHHNQSNFQITDPVNRLYVTKYSGASFGIERSIPITRKLGVVGEFDLVQIFSTSTPSTIAVKQYGYGFEIQGEIYYQMELFGKPWRVGVSYWQQGHESEVDAKDNFRRNSQFQVARALFINLVLLR